MQDADALLRLRLEDFFDDSFSEKLNRPWVDLDTDDINSIGLEIVKVFEEKILPYLNKITDFEILENCFQNANSRHKEYPLTRILYALLKHQIGCLNEAKNILETLTTEKSQAWANRAKAVLHRI